MTESDKYPIKELKLDIWNKKVNATSMFTIPAEDEALPILKELDQILTRLLTLPPEQTISQQHLQYFFTSVFPVVCYKIIRSRYFKSNVVLKYANSILQNCVYLTNKYLEVGIKYPKFLEILPIVLCTDQYYFKSNDQLSYYHYPYSYFPNKNILGENLQKGDFVDVLKIDSVFDKVTWSQGQIVEIYTYEFIIGYLHDWDDRHIKVRKDSPQLAVFETRSKANMEWRMGLKVGDIIDCQEMYGNWYNATIVEVIQKQDKKKKINVVFRVQHPQGNKVDENGVTYYGSLKNDEVLDFDVTSPKIAPFCTVAKQYAYESTKTAYDTVEDYNDYEYSQVNGVQIYAIPRKKYLSSLLFQTINGFGQAGGFQKIINYLQTEVNYDVFCYFSRALCGMAPLLHRKFITNNIKRLKKLVNKYIFGDSQKMAKQFTKEKSEMIFSGVRALQKRVYSNEKVYRFENRIKMKLVESCLDDKLTQKLQGLNQLKDIVKNGAFVAEKNKDIKNWIKEQNIFQKIYIVNSHAQLIKKSQDFLKYLINQSILEVTDLERLYKIAQKSDFETKMTLYKLFQEVAYVFKKHHVQFLIDTILESDLSLIRNQDIDLLHELSRLSNYFPLDKVNNFFQNIILYEGVGNTKISEVNDYAIKKYSDIVVRNLQMKPKRRTVIKNFLDKMQTHDISQITKVLKNIFEGIGVGEWGKKDLYDILADEKIDDVCIQALRKSKESDVANFEHMLFEVLGFLISVYKLSYKIKIHVTTLSQIWNLIQTNPDDQKSYFKWVNQIFTKCEQGLECESPQHFQQYYRKIFTSQRISKMQGLEFEVAKNLFIEINKKTKLLSVTNCLRNNNPEKEYKRKVEMRQLKLLDLLIEMIFQIQNEEISQRVLLLFIELYNSKDNTQTEVDDFLNELLVDLKDYYKNKEYRLINKIFKMLEVVINDSQKNEDANIDSLRKKRSKGEKVKFMVINEIYYASDTVKKIDVLLEMSMTVMDLRKKLAKEFDTTWQEIRITSARQIPDYQNSKTLQEIQLNPSTPLTITKRIIYSTQSSEELMIGDELNPKAVRCFQIIFDRYSTDGLMDKEQCTTFTGMCLGSTSSRRHYNEKISMLYHQYDDDSDGYLTFTNFLKFYKDAVEDRPITVWSNLRSFGVKGNFRFRDEPDQVIESIHKFPRKVLSESKQFYEILFQLLKISECAPFAYELLERLPIYEEILDKILQISSQEAINEILKSEDQYQFYYKLNIIEFLISSEQLKQEKQQKFIYKFVYYHGFEQLYTLSTNIKISPKSLSSLNSEIDINEDILDTILKMLRNYWLAYTGYQRQQSTILKQSISLLVCEYEMNEKIQFLVTGAFSEPEKKLSLIESMLDKVDMESHSWSGESIEKVSRDMLGRLQQLWRIFKQNCNQIEKCTNPFHKQNLANANYKLQSLIFKNLQIIHILFLNQKELAQLLINKLLELLIMSSSIKLLIDTYCMIYFQCSYADAVESHDSIQSIYIRELFRMLTKGSMISTEHFMVLALLVAKYGIGGGDEKKEEVDKMKKILFENVTNNDNEQIIEGCSQLLLNFNLSSTTYQLIEKIWSGRLFNKSTIITREQTKQILYQLILKICDDNPILLDAFVQRVADTIEDSFKHIRIAYCNQFKERSITKYSGMKNLGNICYMNSMLQQIYMNKTFRGLLLRINDFKAPSQTEIFDQKEEVMRIVDDNLLHQTQRIFTYLDLTTRIDYSPKDFCIAYKPFGEPVNIMIQQDVQQFVSMFFDRLENFINHTPFRNIVQEFYSGKTANLFQCPNCKKAKKVQENFHCLTLEIKNAKNLTESFNRFITGEQINDYRCDFCEQKVDVSKKTVISKVPKVLLIHLQRIIFNLDTFINQKLSTKHSFPDEFNLYPYTLRHIEEQANKANNAKKSSEQESAKQQKSEMQEEQSEEKQANKKEEKKIHRIQEEYDYELTGIVCHSGHAEAGHYISYIKTSENKWLQFNDSIVTYFNPADIQSECFGGAFATTSVYDDDYEWENKRETCKCAYMVIYQRKNASSEDSLFKLIFDEKTASIDQESFMREYELEEVIEKLKEEKKMTEVEEKKEGNVEQKTEEQDKNIMDESEREATELLAAKQMEIKRHKSEDNIQVEGMVKQEEVPFKQQQKKPVQKTVIIKTENLNNYHPKALLEEVQHDNQIHFFEKCLSSSNFSKFFSELLRKNHSLADQMLPLCQRLTFGFWLKSPSFKDLLKMLAEMITGHYRGFQDLITHGLVVNLLIENSDSEVRSNIAAFLSQSICDAIESKPNFNIQDRHEPIVKFLDHLLSLLPTTVTKCWTKFSQYFQFWYELSLKNPQTIEYMLHREVIKHFMDYFLDTKSPLKIYCFKKQNQIGSSYASPNFSFLLKCVNNLLQIKIKNGQDSTLEKLNHLNKLSVDEELLLISCEALQKLVSDSYEVIAAQLIKQICPNNLYASQRAAFVILKGISKSNYENIQPYLQILHEFVLIDDQYQDLRIKWVLGKQTLSVSTYGQKLSALHTYTLDERVHNFDSALNTECGVSLLDYLFAQHKKMQNFSMLCLKQLLKLCIASKKIRDHVYNLEAPSLVLHKYMSFFKDFIYKASSYYGYFSSAFNKQELGKQLKGLYDKLIDLIKEEYPEKEDESKEVQEQVVRKQNEDEEQEELMERHVIEDTIEYKNDMVEFSEDVREMVDDSPKEHEDVVVQEYEMEDFSNKPKNYNQEETKKENQGNGFEELPNLQSERSKSNEQNQEPIIMEQKQQSPKRRGNRVRNAHNNNYDQDEIYIDENTSMELSSEEGEPLIENTYEEEKQSSPTLKNTKHKEKDFKQTYHPIIFEYVPVRQVTPPLSGALTDKKVKVTYHESLVTYGVTKPTGTTNKSIQMGLSGNKIVDRLVPEVMEKTFTKIVSGYYIRNETREFLRIQTDDGCTFCRPLEGAWVWSNEIYRIWSSEKSNEMPKWSLYENGDKPE